MRSFHVFAAASSVILFGYACDLKNADSSSSSNGDADAGVDCSLTVASDEQYDLAVTELKARAKEMETDVRKACKNIVQALDTTVAVADADSVTQVCKAASTALALHGTIKIDSPQSCRQPFKVHSECAEACSACDETTTPPMCDGGDLNVRCYGSCAAEVTAPFLRCSGGSCAGESTSVGSDRYTCNATCVGTSESPVVCNGKCNAKGDIVDCRGGRWTSTCEPVANCEASCLARSVAAATCDPPGSIQATDPAVAALSAELTTLVKVGQGDGLGTMIVDSLTRLTASGTGCPTSEPVSEADIQSAKDANAAAASLFGF